MSTKDDGGKAFPSGMVLSDQSEYYGFPMHNDMSLRDYFAAAALQGAMSSYAGSFKLPNHNDLAECAYSVADAMIAERSK